MLRKQGKYQRLHKHEGLSRPCCVGGARVSACPVVCVAVAGIPPATVPNDSLLEMERGRGACIGYLSPNNKRLQSAELTTTNSSCLVQFPRVRNPGAA